MKEPTKQEWKDGEFKDKLLAFLTSSALAWGVLIALLGVTYILLKMPPLAPTN